jgi:protein-disulfide isomerase
MSAVAARAALAANKQGNYYPFYHALLTQTWDSEDGILDIAKSVGLNVSKLKAEMKNPAIATELNANLSLARSLDIPGTPAIYVGKSNATSMNGVQSLPGESSQDDIQSVIDSISKS